MEDTNYLPNNGKRAERRHHRARLKKARRFYWGRDLAKEPVMLSRSVSTATVCSCWMCQNERRRSGSPTIQERRFQQSAKEYGKPDE